MKYLVTVNGEKYEVEVESATGQAAAPVQPAPQPVVQPQPTAVQQPTAAAPAGGEQIKSPLPGVILDVKIAAGDQVKKGQVIFIIEAMKMENEIMSPVDGVVTQVAIAKGASVNTGDLLAVIS